MRVFTARLHRLTDRHPLDVKNDEWIETHDRITQGLKEACDLGWNLRRFSNPAREARNIMRGLPAGTGS